MSTTILAPAGFPPGLQTKKADSNRRIKHSSEDEGRKGVPCLIYKCFLYGNKLIGFGIDSP